MELRVAGIVKESVVDGPGFRYVIFAQGCIHGCKGCHNPETHSFEGGVLCNLDLIIEDIKNSPNLDGITCSGGECFESADKFAIIAQEAKKLGLNVWAYTGYTFEYILEHKRNRLGWEEFVKYIDVLVDGRYEEDKRSLSLSFRGSSNQRLIDVKKSLEIGSVVLFINDCSTYDIKGLKIS